MKVSVLVPVYNSVRFLPECLDSILMQDFGDLEILIADDGSTDGSVEVIKKYAAKDARIRWWQNSRNVGLVANHNVCLRAAQGEFIKFVHADDMLLKPSVVTQMVNVMETNPAVSLVVTSSLIYDEQSRVVRIEDKFRQTGDWDGKAVIVRCLEENANIIGEPVRTLFRRAQAGRGFDERFRQICDLEMWFNLLEQGRFAYLAETLVAYRVHDQQATAIHRRTGVSADEHMLLVTEYCQRPWLCRHATRRMWFNQIYGLKKQYGPRAQSLTADMMKVLKPSWYALYWMRRKTLRPLKKLLKHAIKPLKFACR